MICLKRHPPASYITHSWEQGCISACRIDECVNFRQEMFNDSLGTGREFEVCEAACTLRAYTSEDVLLSGQCDVMPFHGAAPLCKPVSRPERLISYFPSGKSGWLQSAAETQPLKMNLVLEAALIEAGGIPSSERR